MILKFTEEQSCFTINLEINFYQHFANFEVLEQSIFKAFFDNAHDILTKSEDYLSFAYRDKLLSFYYTFFEILTANRSYVVYALEHNKNSLKRMRSLIKLKQFRSCNTCNTKK